MRTSFIVSALILSCWVRVIATDTVAATATATTTATTAVKPVKLDLAKKILDSVSYRLATKERDLLTLQAALKVEEEAVRTHRFWEDLGYATKPTDAKERKDALVAALKEIEAGVQNIRDYATVNTDILTAEHFFLRIVRTERLKAEYNHHFGYERFDVTRTEVSGLVEEVRDGIGNISQLLQEFKQQVDQEASWIELGWKIPDMKLHRKILLSHIRKKEVHHVPSAVEEALTRRFDQDETPIQWTMDKDQLTLWLVQVDEPEPDTAVVMQRELLIGRQDLMFMDIIKDYREAAVMDRLLQRSDDHRESDAAKREL